MLRHAFSASWVLQLKLSLLTTLYQLSQVERGVNGTTHLQGYMELKKKLRFNTIKGRVPLLARAHFEKRRGTQAQAIAYCNKQDTREEGPWTFGSKFEDHSGERSDLEAVRDAIYAGMTKEDVYHEFPKVAAHCPRYVDTLITFYKQSKTIKITELIPRSKFQYRVMDLISGPPHDREINWYYDAVGGAGKTHISKYLVHSHDAFCCNDGRSVDIVHAYNGEPICIFDFMRDSAKSVNYNVIEQVKNGLMFSSKYESAIKSLNIPHVIVFANFLPYQKKFSKDRYVVCDISDPDHIKDVSYDDLPLCPKDANYNPNEFV